MAGFIIRTVNSTFATRVEFPDILELDIALAHGVKSGIMIATDEISNDVSVATVEVIIENASGEALRRSAVTISVAPLLTDMATSYKS
ncbi:MAG: hypothetical protein EOO38_24640 [Cytophagaceae bacterium]|nr:MAG: hypothetical protein EOO38_24640 [Cytophagaceae bacterium]